MRVGLVVHPGRPEAIKAAADLVEWCRGRDLSTVALEDIDIGADERNGGDLDLLVTFGGDGTLLRGALIAAAADAPVLGVNVGRLGFLTEVEPQELPEVMEELLAGRLEIDARLALAAETEAAPDAGPIWALNEVAVEKRTRHRLATLAVTVGSDHVTTFSADAVIVASPTGSTAYSFSAGGPIVSPDARCLVITPVAPHMVFDRTLVVPADATVSIEVVGEEPALLSPDGRPTAELPVGARVRIRLAEHPARLLRRPRTESFFAKLRRKFFLPEGPLG
ncbi:MAG TPA: NAD(+)/NADH kinase [Actinomycetota bacterium]